MPARLKFPLLLALSAAFTPSRPRARALSCAGALSSTVIAPTSEYDDIRAASRFFASEFFASELGLPDRGFPPDDARHVLDATVALDFESRYGELVGSRRLASSLLLARDGTGGAVVGCAGVELAVVLPAAAIAGAVPARTRVLARAEAEKRIAAELSALRPRERNTLRKAPLAELVPMLIGDGTAVRPVLSNLAVARAARRRGLGRELVAACERVARDEWASDALLLIVEAANEPARALYRGLGFEEAWCEDTPATRAVFSDGPGTFIETASVTVPKVIMRKKL